MSKHQHFSAPTTTLCPSHFTMLIYNISPNNFPDKLKIEKIFLAFRQLFLLRLFNNGNSVSTVNSKFVSMLKDRHLIPRIIFKRNLESLFFENNWRTSDNFMNKRASRPEIRMKSISEVWSLCVLLSHNVVNLVLHYNKGIRASQKTQRER